MTAKASQRAVKPKVTIEEWGIFKKGEVSPTNASYTCQINSPPSVAMTYTITPTTADSGAIETKSTSILQRLGQQQTASFEGKVSPDASAHLYADEQDKSDQLEFGGFACCDTFGVSPGQIDSSGTAAVTWTEIEALNYGIYGPENKNTSPYASGVEGSSFLEIVKNIEKKLYESWTNEVYEAKKKTDKNQAELQKKIHERNGKLRGYFLDVLEASKDTIGWPKINQYLAWDSRKDKKLPAQSLRESIAGTVCGYLQNGGGSFLGTLLQIGELFQCVFVPSTDSTKPGKFVNKALAVGGPPETLKLDIISVSGRAASSFGLLPVSHVFLKPPDAKNTAVYARANGVCAPKEAADKGGAQIAAPMPPWWMPALQTEDIQRMEEAQGNATARKAMAVLGKVFPKIEQINKATTDQVAIEFDVGYMWAMVVYAWSVLAGSTASVQVPGTFKIEPGKRYKVQNSKGEEMFTGFLTGFSTSIAPGNCLTNLVFSHIMFPGFKLPGEDELKSAGILS